MTEQPPLEPTSEEKSLLIQLINKGLKKVESKISPEGVILKDLDDIIEKYGMHELLQILESLSEKKILTIKEHNPTIFCPKCNAIQVYSSYICPKCKTTDVKLVELIEHPFCGYIGIKEKYISKPFLVCPNCNTNLSLIEIEPSKDNPKKDYKVIGSSFECKNCRNKFDRPNIIHICQMCGKVFNYRTAVYKKLHDYEIPEQVIKTMHVQKEYKILLIEDNKQDAMIITKYFTKAGNKFKLEHVSIGEEGLEKIDQKYYDLIFLDYKLPGMSGLEILKEIKKRDISTPVIMLTGADERTTAVEAMKLGASDYLIKSDDTFKKLPLITENIVRAPM